MARTMRQHRALRPPPQNVAAAATNRPTAPTKAVIPAQHQQQIDVTTAIGPSAVIAYVALGANLGNRGNTLQDALHRLAHTADIELLQASSFYRTAPIGAIGPDYLNGVVKIRTTLSAHDLLAALQAIETTLGRKRPYRNAPRTLDLDILLYGEARIESATLTVPHPRMWERAFVLVPMAELAPDLVTEQALQAVAGQVIARCTRSGIDNSR